LIVSVKIQFYLARIYSILFDYQFYFMSCESIAAFRCSSSVYVTLIAVVVPDIP